MRVFLAGMVTETNTWSPFPAGELAFEQYGITRAGSRRKDFLLHPALSEWRRLAEADGHEVVESWSLMAMPGSRTPRAVYEKYRDAIIEDLARAQPVDLVLLWLHGAMLAEGYDDCEGDLLRRAREIVGRRSVIGVLFDPHCHLSQDIVDYADIPVLMKEYPHVDEIERARDIYALALRTAAGEIRPVRALYDCRMVGFYPTTRSPMREIVREMEVAEGRDKVLSVSFAHGFPWADVPDVGSRMLVIADGDREAAQRLAEEFGRRIFSLRHEVVPRFLSMDEGLDEALTVGGTVVLADTADNAGGGAPGDNPALLRRILERGISGVASGCYWDPIAVGFCRDAGVGSRIDLRIGGKCGPASGVPLDVTVTVRALTAGYEQTSVAGNTDPLGAAAWVEVGGVHVVLNSVRAQVMHPDAFTNLGIPLDECRIITVKSSHHFHAGFAPIAERIIHLATPGAIQLNFAELPYRRRDLRYWPRVAEPFAAG